MSKSLRPHGLQHARLPCPSPTPRACSNSCPSSQWCHPTISSSVMPFSSRLQPFQASESFQISQFFASDVAQLLKNLPAKRETWVQSLGWEDPLEKGKASHSNILPWSPWGRKELDMTEQLSLSQQMAKTLELLLQHQPFQWTMRTWLLWSPCSPRDCQESSLTPQLKGTILWHSAFSVVQYSHPYMTTEKKH